jgi:drug/metabolite transporter (DMT)-like permease
MCCVLLACGYFRTRVPLLYWAAVCFAAFGLEGAVMIVNEYVPADLTVLRLSISLVGIVLLLYGLLWNSEPRG